jgi:hypothetical protein
MKKSSEKILIASGFISAITGFVGSLTNLLKLFIPVAKEAAVKLPPAIAGEEHIVYSMPAPPPPVQEEGSFTAMIIWGSLLLLGIAVTIYGVYKSKKRVG